MAVTHMPDGLATKLAKVLGLLGSDHDGEVAAAGRRAYQLLTGAGLTWPEVIAPAAPIPQQPYRAPRRWRRPASSSDAAALCLQWPEVLTPWENEFCRSLVGRHRISAKQSAVLARIADKVETSARATGEA